MTRPAPGWWRSGAAPCASASSSSPRCPPDLQLASIAVSPDGAFVLAVADRAGRPVEEAEPVPGGQLFLGQFGPDGIIGWSERPIAPGLGRVFSPVWVDPVTVAFIAETSNKDDLGKLWTIRSDGWDPTAVFNDSDLPIGDIGNHLTVDPDGSSFVVTARTTSGASLWMVNRQEKSVELPHPPHRQRLRRRPQLRQPLTTALSGPGGLASQGGPPDGRGRSAPRGCGWGGAMAGSRG